MNPSNELRTFLFTYRHDGADYALRVPASSQEEALARVRRMSTAVYDGEVMARIPVSMGWAARAAVKLRNALRG